MRVGLIHAVAVAIQPITDAFARLWPEAELANLLDDRLSVDRAKDPDLTPHMFGRIGSLADYAEINGAEGILYTCSAFGEAIERVAQAKTLPVLKPNEAMFEAALSHGQRIAMLATFERSVASMEDEFRQLAARRRQPSAIDTVCVPEAMAALQAGDEATHNGLLARAAERLAHFDAIMLAQFSTSVARASVADVVDCPVLTSPDTAVLKLRSRLAA